MCENRIRRYLPEPCLTALPDTLCAVCQTILTLFLEKSSDFMISFMLSYFHVNLRCKYSNAIHAQSDETSSGGFHDEQ